MNTDRRSFITKSLLAAGALTQLGQTAFGNTFAKPAPGRKKRPKAISIEKNTVILFQGDSITDAGRDRNRLGPNDTNAFGNGYAMIAASTLLEEFAEKDIQLLNRGIGGHKVPQLQQRWQADTLDLKPHILSILIGINDYWHKRNGQYEGSAEAFKSQYRQLLQTTLAALPQVKLIIGEPFAVKNVKHVDDSWFPELSAYQAATKELAEEFNAIFIPYQQLFDEAEKRAPGTFWTSDGVHTTLAGANLMAKAWLQYANLK